MHIILCLRCCPKISRPLTYNHRSSPFAFNTRKMDNTSNNPPSDETNGGDGERGMEGDGWREGNGGR